MVNLVKAGSRFQVTEVNEAAPQGKFGRFQVAVVSGDSSTVAKVAAQKPKASRFTVEFVEAASRGNPGQSQVAVGSADSSTVAKVAAKEPKASRFTVEAVEEDAEFDDSVGSAPASRPASPKGEQDSGYLSDSSDSDISQEARDYIFGLDLRNITRRDEITSITASLAQYLKQVPEEQGELINLMCLLKSTISTALVMNDTNPFEHQLPTDSLILFVENFKKTSKLEEQTVRLGSGSEATTYKVTLTGQFGDTTTLVAKRFNPKDFKLRNAILESRFDHPNVLAALAIDESRHSSYHVLAKYGDLGGFIAKANSGKGGFEITASFAMQTALSIFSGLDYLHSLNLLHTDIKPGNILVVDLEGRCKVADFGLMLDLNRGKTNKGQGTLEYAAPEVMACCVKDDDCTVGGTKPSDVWSTGASIYELVTGSPLFSIDDTNPEINHVLFLAGREKSGFGLTPYMLNLYFANTPEATARLKVRDPDGRLQSIVERAVGPIKPYCALPLRITAQEAIEELQR